MTHAIDVQHISKFYGAFKAVDDLSFHVEPGEIFALLGPNGAGKSTSIRMILDILKPDSGSIAVLGGAMTDAKKNRIGYLPEERGLYKDVNVIDVMAYLGKLKGLSDSDARQRGKTLLAKLDLADHADSNVEELSKGMQQKVQFAVTVIHEPELIIIDEPFSGLDPVNRLVIKNLLEEMRDKGVAIVMSTHRMEQVEEMADRMLMISRGQQKLYGKIDAIQQEFAEHAIVVQGTGDWQSLPGVERVKQGDDKRGSVTLYLSEAVTMDDVLEAIARDDTINIRRFEQAIPSLDEIFIRVAGEKVKAHA